VIDNRVYSEYLRLQSWLGYKGEKDVFRMAKYGLVNASGILNKTTFINGQEIEIVGKNENDLFE